MEEEVVDKVEGNVECELEHGEVSQRWVQRRLLALTAKEVIMKKLPGVRSTLKMLMAMITCDVEQFPVWSG